VFADQAVFTSMLRRGKSGYHLVARSQGVTESEASAFSTWSPSHGGLIVDAANRASVNYFPLPTGRFALARTIAARPEYSGRGGRQLFTRAVVFDAAKLRQSGFRPFAIYRDALALGHLAYDAYPQPILRKVELSGVYPAEDEGRFDALLHELGAARVEGLLAQLEAGRSVEVAYAGDRTALAEMLLSQLTRDALVASSAATSLHPSAVRPYRLSLVAPA
jgi:hypothetical protein